MRLGLRNYTVCPPPLVYLWFALLPSFTSGLPFYPRLPLVCPSPLVYLWFALPPPRLPHLESSSKSSLTSLCSAELGSVSNQVPENIAVRKLYRFGLTIKNLSALLIRVSSKRKLLQKKMRKFSFVFRKRFFAFLISRKFRIFSRTRIKRNFTKK